VSPTQIEIVNFIGSALIPLESIQSIGVAGFIWKHLEIHTTRYYEWESGMNARKAEFVRQFILDARHALLTNRGR
jgi:hypothetical protein